MPGFKIVTNPADLVYLYDGSLAGFFCCVHRSFYERELPIDILPEAADQPSIYPRAYISTDQAKAEAVRASIVKNLSDRVIELTEHVFLCHHPHKEQKLLRFLIFAFGIGPKAAYMLGEDAVADVLEMEKHLLGEVHLLRGFIRFADYGEMLGGVITPKNFVLPLLAAHFANRFPNENFMIYDKTHKAVLAFQGGKLEITMVEEVEFSQPSEDELRFQSMWKNFYKTIGIEERVNPRCRMGHMPKRYWQNMTEMREYL
ncbi:MAG: TIGR03915 family putative DNA repair protein [Oscillospiraceae bacterium]|nr:TIGR03915 family putative DNA repair protein [Oscillospiraceae bacterium]